MVGPFGSRSPTDPVSGGACNGTKGLVNNPVFNRFIDPYQSNTHRLALTYQLSSRLNRELASFSAVSKAMKKVWSGYIIDKKAIWNIALMVIPGVVVVLAEASSVNPLTRRYWAVFRKPVKLSYSTLTWKFREWTIKRWKIQKIKHRQTNVLAHRPLLLPHFEEIHLPLRDRCILLFPEGEGMGRLWGQWLGAARPISPSRCLWSMENKRRGSLCGLSRPHRPLSVWCPQNPRQPKAPLITSSFQSLIVQCNCFFVTKL